MRLSLLTLLLTMSTLLHADALTDLAARISPDLDGRVIFDIDAAAKTIEVAPAAGNKIAITAPNTRLAAAGLGCYLRSVAKAHWSWCGDRLDGAMPAPRETLTFTPAFPHTLAYNYCTLSYTMAFWDKKTWQKEIDHLALYGFEFPLVQAGLPKVWQLTLRELGYPEERITAFIPDEAAAAWWNMGNLEGLGGPLAQERIDGDAELGKFLVHQMKALGMRPILQGFVGLLPHDIQKYLSNTEYPDAKFLDQGNWVDRFRRPTLLLPNTEAFAKVAEIWYRNLFEVYGVEAADAFGGDLFHEGGNSRGANVTACAEAVQAAQQKASPGAIWMIQAWHNNPTPALLKGVNPKYAIVEALVRDQATGNMYKKRFADVPWLWCELLNFGGNHGLYGGLNAVANLGKVLEQPGAPTLAGYGLLSEGLETNPLFYELFTERFFMPKDKNMSPAELNAWFKSYAKRRYDSTESGIIKALEVLAKSVYAPAREQEGCTESIVCAKPSWTARKASSWASGEQYYAAQDTLLAAAYLLDVAWKNPELTRCETFRYDLVDVTRQALADLSRPLLSLAQGNPEAREAFLEAIRLTDRVMAFEPRWTLAFQEERVEAVGGEKAKQAYRRMITSWSGRRGALNDYANRQLSGLLAGYYLKRWELFFKEPNAKDLQDRYDAITNAFIAEGEPQTPVSADDFLPTLRKALLFARQTQRKWPNAFKFQRGVNWALNGNRQRTTLTFSVSEYIAKAGTYEVEIKFNKGRHALKIEKVELYEGDKLVASDKHAGYTGIKSTDNTYILKIDQYRTGLDDYRLEITGQGDNGGNSAGIFTITLQE